MELNKDFKEFIELLNEHDVKYLIVGGYAVNFHGYPRYTKDIDFWIWLEPSNIEQLVNAINDFGFSSLGLTENDFLMPDNVVQLGRTPYRIDIMVDLESVDFEDCYSRRSESVLDNVIVNFLGLEDLIVTKENAGRRQDLADAEQLEKIRKNQK